MPRLFRRSLSSFWLAFGSSLLTLAAANASPLRATSVDATHAWSRATGLGDRPAATVCAFDLALSDESSAGSQLLRIGTADATYASLAVTVETGAAGFQLRDGVAGERSATFEGNQAITWALNPTDGAVTYVAPNGSVRSLASDRMDVWVGRSLVFEGAAVAGHSVPLVNLEWETVAGSGATRVQRLDVRPLAQAVATRDEEPKVESQPNEVADAGVATLELGRPAPNPFARTMRFAYAVPTGTAPVEVAVFDVSGRLVRNLARGVQGTGRHEVSWDGLSEDRRRVQAGVYFLRSMVGASTKVSRIVYLMN